MLTPINQLYKDVFVKVAVCSLSSFFDIRSLTIVMNESNRKKIVSVLKQSLGVKFILFPEYTYASELEELYQNHSNQNNCIIIGGSGLESNGENFYAFAPVFIPNQPLLKVYKRNITPFEESFSGSKIIGYPREIQRVITVPVKKGLGVTISVYVCLDFMRENKPKERSHIIFVPQYERKPQSFIAKANDISREDKIFVLGANNSEHRSIGFVPNSNSQVRDGLIQTEWRKKGYPPDEEVQNDEHNTISYDITGEKLITFYLNLRNPIADQFTSTSPHGQTRLNFKPLKKLIYDSVKNKWY